MRTIIDMCIESVRLSISNPVSASITGLLVIAMLIICIVKLIKTLSR